MRTLRSFVLVAFVATFLGAVQAQENKNKNVDLNPLDFKSWIKNEMTDQDVEEAQVFLVVNVRPEYLEDLKNAKAPQYRKEDLAKIAGAEYVNSASGNVEKVLLFSDPADKQDLFAVHVNDENQLSEPGSLQIFYKTGDKWMIIPDKILEELFDVAYSPVVARFLYEKTGKLIYYKF